MICAFLGHYGAHSGNYLRFGTALGPILTNVEDGTEGSSRNVGKQLPLNDT
jgi:hypothetical protein